MFQYRNGKVQVKKHDGRVCNMQAFQYRNGKVQEQQIVFYSVLYHMIKEMSIDNPKKVKKIPSISQKSKVQQTAL